MLVIYCRIRTGGVCRCWRKGERIWNYYFYSLRGANSCGRSTFLLHPTAVQLNAIFSKLRLSVQDRKILSVSYCFKLKKAQKVEKEDACPKTLYKMEKSSRTAFFLLQFPSTSPNRSKYPREAVLTLFSLIVFSARKPLQTFHLQFEFSFFPYL